MRGMEKVYTECGIVVITHNLLKVVVFDFLIYLQKYWYIKTS